MITVSHPNAELLKVFLYKDEKQALKELSQKQGIPMYHLVRKMILELLEQQNESQAS
jgi:transcriptional regulator of NAD metabolism